MTPTTYILEVQNHPIRGDKPRIALNVIGIGPWALYAENGGITLFRRIEGPGGALLCRVIAYNGPDESLEPLKVKAPVINLAPRPADDHGRFDPHERPGLRRIWEDEPAPGLVRVSAEARPIADLVPNDPPAPEARTIKPVRGREWASEFFIPLAQEAVKVGLACIGGLVTFVFLDAQLANVPYTFPLLGITRRWAENWGFWSYAKLWAVIWVNGLAWSFWGIGEKLEDLLYVVEEATGLDINGDGETGEPRFAPRPIPVNDNGRPAGFVDMPTGPDEGKFTVADWRSFSAAVLWKGAAISRRGINGETRANNWQYGLIGQAKATAMIKVLEDAAMVEEGELTGRGWDYLFQYLPEHLTAVERPEG